MQKGQAHKAWGLNTLLLGNYCMTSVSLLNSISAGVEKQLAH